MNMGTTNQGLYANIAAKKKRIEAQKAAGKTPERMRKVGSKGAPTAADFKQAAKTAKKLLNDALSSFLVTTNLRELLTTKPSLTLF
jgi:hypothetical protein